MSEAGKLRIAEKDAAFVLKKNWDIEVAIPKETEEGGIPENVRFVACLLLLTRKDPDFMNFVWGRAEKLFEQTADDDQHLLDPTLLNPPISGNGRDDEQEESGTVDLDVEKGDAAFVLKDGWDVSLQIPLYEEGQYQDSLPENILFVAVLVALIKSDPEFVQFVRDRGERYLEEIQTDDTE